MRRSPKLTICLSLLLGCICFAWTLNSDAAEGGARRSASPEGAEEPFEKPDSTNPKKHSFPFSAFETLFDKLAEEMGLGGDSETEKLPAALEKLFTSIPDPSTKQSKGIKPTRQGLLKKMLANRMERQSGGKGWDVKTFTREFQRAMKLLGDFGADSGMSPEEALQKIAQVTHTLLTADGAENLQQHMGHTASLLKDLLPFLPGAKEEEL